MSAAGQPSTPLGRERAKAHLRALTRGAIFAATGATVAIGVVVAHDRPGAGAARTTASSGATSSSTTPSNNTSTSDSGTAGNTGDTGTSSPTTSSMSPAVTSGGTSR
jgi:hypothetical protein